MPSHSKMRLWAPTASICHAVCIPGALLVGVAAGVISVVGFAFLTPLLERLIGLGDTCGVHNLHGIPGILGGLVREQLLSSLLRREINIAALSACSMPSPARQCSSP